MRFEKQVHWSEGLFLQPHHLQKMQHDLTNIARQQRNMLSPFPYGFIDLEIDNEALTSRRIVIKHFSAIMPDGQELSMPGNCNVAPLELTFDSSASTELIIYLALPLHSELAPNLVTEQNSSKGRYRLSEVKIVDENTTEDEIPVMVREMNAFLLTDIKNARECTYLPLCKVQWVSINAGLPSLRLEKNYIPPFFSLSSECPILSMASELVFQLKGARNSIISKFDLEGFDPTTMAASKMLLVEKLRIVGVFARILDSELVPERISLYDLYLELVTLLTELESLTPMIQAADVPKYDHDDPYTVFNLLISRIRAILLQGSVSTALSFEFSRVDNLLSLEIEDDHIFSSNELFLALQFEGNLRDRVLDIEEGDNFRLIDKKSFSDRIRGVKLSEVRYPPQYLPTIGHTLWFKVMLSQSENIWKYITEERNMVIDCAGDLFPDLKATLYVSIESGS